MYNTESWSELVVCHCSYFNIVEVIFILYWCFCRRDLFLEDVADIICADSDYENVVDNLNLLG